MKDKVFRLLGLAKKSGSLISGYNTCIHYLDKNKVKLLIIAEDASDNTKGKFTELAVRKNITYFIWGNKDDLSHWVGMENRSVLGIINENFASAIISELSE
ncbi:MAG: 50S ribosomal protein L7ae [Clostridiales bacterium]|nr:50S ribosomal protein L7ae [Clostridiales bacterium]